MESMLTQVRDGVGSSATLTWVPEDFLSARGVAPWSDMPAGVPAYPIMYVDIAASMAAGLSFRPIAQTAGDTLAYEQARPGDDDRAIPCPCSA